MSSADAKASEKQAAVLAYLQKHQVNEELNIVVNKLAQNQSEDPFAFIVRQHSAQ
jgi:hypothetical protein